MNDTLTFLHTAAVHVDTFNQLCAEMAPDIPLRHIVDVSLLEEARAAGGLTEGLRARVAAVVAAAVRNGARVVLCTCSTIGACAEAAGAQTQRVVLRVDRPMAEAAIERGRRILVAAALDRTIAPTRQLLASVAAARGREIQISELLCERAWAIFERGDQDGYLQEIATALRQGAPYTDVIVLAQASMADAATRCPDIAIPILSSPRLGVAAAIAAYRVGSHTGAA